ncbi:tRNA (adenosine(37)-N6)-threonylcarbamoyltransferase complex ATPase subunit type 1 TsaE [Candidatus Peregrinibacteria bacterium CG_4_9_14_0_8_um_filter_44_15]|nr:MAG: tRNA (adenosine(37)-N6)-threonylcarbamoyltransferase complex ATPase subunit type 1 TsaE [Candidatus Peregrinibacteria bacterium CG_4_9_14_0_8_um_filter_44_15]
MLHFKSENPDETKKLAAQIREKYPTHKLILLSGELGSGKTTFTKGIANHLGMDEKDIKSPTFALMREYDDLLHVDLYRLEQPDYLIMDQIEAFVSRGGLVIVEWPEVAIHLMPKPHIHIKIDTEDDTRRFEITENS